MTDHGKWSLPGVPHKGWTCVDDEDLGRPRAICEMCEEQKIRYVHYMTHPDFDGTLAVGCICAGHMEENPQAAKAREKTLQNIAKRKANWLSRNWRRSTKGNEYLNVDGMNVVVYPKGTKWAARISDRHTDQSITSKQSYSTSDAAKLAAFDKMIELRRKEGWGDQFRY